MELTRDEIKKLKVSEYNRKYRENNKEKIKLIQKNFYENVIKCNDEYLRHVSKRNIMNKQKRRQKLIDEGVTIKKQGRPRTVLNV